MNRQLPLQLCPLHVGQTRPLTLIHKSAQSSLPTRGAGMPGSCPKVLEWFLLVLLDLTFPGPLNTRVSLLGKGARNMLKKKMCVCMCVEAGQREGESMRLYTWPWSHTEPQLPNLLREFMPLTFTIPSVKWASPPRFPFRGCPDVMCVKLFAQSPAHDHYLTSASSHCFRGSANQSFTYLHLPSMLMRFADKSAAAPPPHPPPCPASSRGKLGSWKAWQFCDQRDLRSCPLTKLFTTGSVTSLPLSIKWWGNHLNLAGWF